jgi:hypothetical protein
MPGLTPNQSYPYPLYTEAMDPATQIQALATAVDTSIVAVNNTITAATTRVLAQALGSAAQSIPNAVSTAMQFNTETFDSDNMINLGTDNTLLTVTVAGSYLIVAECEWAANATGSREIFVVWSGGGPQYNYATRAVTGDVTRTNIGEVYRASIGQTFRINVIQSSGAALNSTLRRVSAIRVSS